MMLDRKVVLKEIIEKGSFRLKLFADRANHNDLKEYEEIIANMTRTLYDKGLSPIEIKGFFEYAVAISELVVPIQE